MASHRRGSPIGVELIRRGFRCQSRTARVCYSISSGARPAHRGRHARCTASHLPAGCPRRRRIGILSSAARAQERAARESVACSRADAHVRTAREQRARCTRPAGGSRSPSSRGRRPSLREITTQRGASARRSAIVTTPIHRRSCRRQHASGRCLAKLLGVEAVVARDFPVRCACRRRADRLYCWNSALKPLAGCDACPCGRFRRSAALRIPGRRSPRRLRLPAPWPRLRN